MRLVRRLAYYLFLLIGVLLVLATVGSLIYNSSLWYIQLLNFPRLQVLIALIVYLPVRWLVIKKRHRLARVFTTGLVACVGIQAYILFPYTPLAAEAVLSASTEAVDQQSVFSLIVANVWIENRRADKLMAMIADKNPTFVLTMEVNDRWLRQLASLKKNYPYQLTFPTNNAYGMALYSKLPLNKSQIIFLHHNRVPCFKTTVTLPNNYQFQLYTLHPVAPVPSQYPTNIGGKEVALLKAGRLIAQNPGPTVVAGDFNDVGWSHNTTQFSAMSGLHDVRYGRGMYSTFDAHSLLMRWPLDYVFVSPEFKVLNLERLPAFGSDHFPYYVQLTAAP